MPIDIDLTSLTESELIELDRQVVQRIRDLRQAKTYSELAKFAVGDRVSFEAKDGRRVEGEVIRVSKKTVTICSRDQHHWRVSPSFLHKISGPNTRTSLFVVDQDEDDESSEPSQEQFDRSQKQVASWLTEFEASASFKGLIKSQKHDAAHIITAFGDLMYTYSGYMPTKWTDSAVYDICLDVMPRKISAPIEFFASIRPVLTAFFSFLADRGYQKNATAIAGRLDEIGDQIIIVASDRSHWGPAKALVAEAREAGADPADKASMQRFIQRRNLELANQLAPRLPDPFGRQEPVRNENKVGRNEPCPCGSGKKYKKCCERQLRIAPPSH